MDLLKKRPDPAVPKSEKQVKGDDFAEAKFDQPCAVCGKAPTEVKWMGQYFHKKCRRAAKKMAGRMI